MHMVLWGEEMHRAVLYFVRPAVRMIESVMQGTFKDIILAKKKNGFSMELTKKYYKVLDRFAAVVKEQGFQDISHEVEIARDVLTAMIDEELYWTPRWHNQLLLIAKEEGLLEPVTESG